MTQRPSHASRALLAPLVLGLLAFGACKDEPPPTEILVSVTSNIGIDRLELRARGLATDWLVLEEDLGTRDLTESEWTVLVQPSREISGRFMLWGKGYANNVYVAGAVVTLAFERHRTLEAELPLLDSFPALDLDNDGFPRCTRPGDDCDCDDANSARGPFVVEACYNQVDDNCSGWPPDEGCGCESGAPPVFCTGLPEAQWLSAGLGVCHLGQLRCIEGVLESECDYGVPAIEENNGLDDDCDGVVDEEFPCSPTGSSRPCFLGLPAEEIAAAVKGQCVAGHQSCINDGAGGGKWANTCADEVRPQRRYDLDANGNPVESYGWAETDAIASIGDGQCDGLDNDCDGQFDEEPWFDADRDGYTGCGTTFDPSSVDPTKNTFAVGGRAAEFLDCDDGNAGINPGAWEQCGDDNYVDEDCRCDHGPNIGSPRQLLDGTVICSTVLTYLSCTIEPRSDSTDVGNCADTPDPYFGGYDVAGACHYCGLQFGLTCDAATQACMRKETACSGCVQQGAEAEARPTCYGPQTGTCTNAVAPAWVDVATSTPADPYDDCTGLSCAAYFAGIEAGRCYARADLSTAEHLCKNGGTCQTTVDVCPTRPRAPSPVAVGTCMMVTAGCVGTTGPSESPQTAGQDLFAQCNTVIDSCDANVGGVGPFYEGISGSPAQCYFKATPSDNTCEGSGRCRTRAEECTAAGVGAVAPRATCMIPTGGCTGTTAPSYQTVYAAAGGVRTDPYNECAGALNCCQEGSSGVCCKATGTSCANASECTSGFCVDGVCCGNSCASACTACSQALNGVANGSCLAINAQVTDTVPSNLCSATSNTCGGGACVCEPGSSACKKANGVTCFGNSECASAQCECANGGCSTRVCSAVDCNCTYNADGDGTCEGNIGDGTDDADDQCGAYTCNSVGGCNLPNGTACTTDVACETNYCECANGACSARVCSAVDCDCRVSNGTSCSGNLSDGIDDPDNSCGALTCNGLGACNLANNAICTTVTDQHCESNQCECSDSTCGAKRCSAGDCNCTFNANGDTSCEGNISDSSDDADNTCAALSCNGAGACNLGDTAPCSGDQLCESNNCECNDASCSGRQCRPGPHFCQYNSGSVGNLSVGTQDPEDCSVTVAGGSCGTPPCACDGAAGCRQANNTDCSANSNCASNQCECANAACSGSKRCSEVDCNCTYNSNGDGTCEGSISDGTDDADDWCGALSCNGAGGCNLATGTACSISYTCESNNCIDGYCCNSVCGGNCDRCNVGGSLGTCTSVQSDCTGNCDVCNAGTCQADQGLCPASAGWLCSTCTGGGTAFNCTYDGSQDTDCTSVIGAGYECYAYNDCRKLNGQSCTGAIECASGNCVDGYCCNTACNTTCQACSAAFTASPNGTCAAIDVQMEDTVPSDLCTTPDIGCSASNNLCECSDASPGSCLEGTGSACSSDSECASNNCLPSNSCS